MNQGNLTVATYYNKMKKFWDELHSLNGIPTCTYGKMRECGCGITDKFLDIDSRSKLMQFLMSLNDDFESVRNQILSMDPLPSINKANYIVQQVEKKKQVINHVHEPSAFFANLNNNNKNSHAYKNVKDNKIDKKKCSYCHVEGHDFDQCFERIGYPDWYKGKKNKKGARVVAQVYSNTDFGMHKDTPFDMSFETEVNGEHKGELDQRFVDVVCQEMFKMFQNKDLLNMEMKLLALQDHMQVYLFM